MVKQQANRGDRTLTSVEGLLNKSSYVGSSVSGEPKYSSSSTESGVVGVVEHLVPAVVTVAATAWVWRVESREWYLEDSSSTTRARGEIST